MVVVSVLTNGAARNRQRVGAARHTPEVVNLTRIYTRGGDAGETRASATAAASRRPAPASRPTAPSTSWTPYIGAAAEHPSCPTAGRVAGADPERACSISAPTSACPRRSGPDRSSERERTRLRVDASQVAWLEARCDEVNDALPPLTSFILPGGTPAAAELHVCRTVCRRAEREIVALAAHEPSTPRRRRTPTASPTCCSSWLVQPTRRVPSRSGSRAHRGPAEPLS